MELQRSRVTVLTEDFNLMEKPYFSQVCLSNRDSQVAILIE